MTCLHSVTFLVVLGLFFSFRLPWFVHSTLVGLFLSLKFTNSPLEHTTCHLLENGRCKLQLHWLYGNRLSPTFSPHGFPQIRRGFSFLRNVKNLKRVFFPVASYILFKQPKNEHSTRFTLFLRAFRHLEPLLILSLVFIQTGNRKSESCKASMEEAVSLKSPTQFRVKNNFA